MQPLWKNPAALSTAVLIFVSGIDAGVVHAPKVTNRLRRQASSLIAHRHKSKEPSWGYGDAGGTGWANAGYAKCAMKDQSPVDLSKIQPAAEPNGQKLFFRYRPYTRAIPLFNDGRLIAWTAQEWRSEEIGHIGLGTEYPHGLTEYYSLFQVVIHTPSEHTYNGVRVPLELQLYHRKMDLIDGAPKALAEGEAVVAIGFYESEHDNEVLAALGSHGAPMDTGQEVLANNNGDGLDFSSLFKKDANDGGGAGETVAFLEYTGSMTTPPCDTGVRWFVRPDALPASHEVLEKFRAAADAVAGARDAGAGNARRLQDSGGRSVFLFETEDTTALKTPAQAHEAMHVNTSPRDQTGLTPTVEPGAVTPVVAPGGGEEPEEPVQEDDSSAAAPKEEGPSACQVNFNPSDVGAILCCWSAISIETSPEVIITRNGKFQEAQQEAEKADKDLADAENNKNEQCEAFEDAQKKAETAEPGPEQTAANAKASTFSSGCEQAKKMINDLTKEKESWDAKVMGVRGQIEGSLKKASNELKNAKGGFPCTQESVEIVNPKAAEMDPTMATVDIGHSFPRYLAPGNPHLIAGADSGLVEMQMPKRSRHMELLAF